MIRKILRLGELIDERFVQEEDNDDPLATDFFKLEFEKKEGYISLRIYKQEDNLNKYNYNTKEVLISDDPSTFVSELIGEVRLTKDMCDEIKDFFKGDDK